MAARPRPLRRDGSSLVASFTLDPRKRRQTRAESDVIAGKIIARPVTLEQALTKRMTQEVAGSINVRIDLAPDGSVVRRTRLVTIETKDKGGASTRETREEVTEATRVQ